MTKQFDAIVERSLTDPEGFWGEAARGIDWDKEWDVVLDRNAAPIYRWFSGGLLNTCYNAVDRHVAQGRADQLAIIYDSPMTGKVERFTYRELEDLVARFAGALTNEGVTKGDRVIIYMPMIAQAVMAMLACARLGIRHGLVLEHVRRAIAVHYDRFHARPSKSAGIV